MSDEPTPSRLEQIGVTDFDQAEIVAIVNGPPPNDPTPNEVLAKPTLDDGHDWRWRLERGRATVPDQQAAVEALRGADGLREAWEETDRQQRARIAELEAEVKHAHDVGNYQAELIHRMSERGHR